MTLCPCLFTPICLRVFKYKPFNSPTAIKPRVPGLLCAFPALPSVKWTMNLLSPKHPFLGWTCWRSSALHQEPSGIEHSSVHWFLYWYKQNSMFIITKHKDNSECFLLIGLVVMMFELEELISGWYVKALTQLPVLTLSKIYETEEL